MCSTCGSGKSLSARAPSHCHSSPTSDDGLALSRTEAARCPLTARGSTWRSPSPLAAPLLVVPLRDSLLLPERRQVRVCFPCAGGAVASERRTACLSVCVGRRSWCAEGEEKGGESSSRFPDEPSRHRQSRAEPHPQHHVAPSLEVSDGKWQRGATISFFFLNE